MTKIFLFLIFFLDSFAEGNPLPEPTHPRFTYCYAVQLSIPSPRLPVIERVLENEVAQLRYKTETMKMNQEHFWKMVGGHWLICFSNSMLFRKPYKIGVSRRQVFKLNFFLFVF